MTPQGRPDFVALGQKFKIKPVSPWSLVAFAFLRERVAVQKTEHCVMAQVARYVARKMKMRSAPVVDFAALERALELWWRRRLRFLLLLLLLLL